MEMLKVEALSLNYGKQTILDNISFSIGKGQIVGLLGPNGAGKSSMLKVLSGLVRPQSGQVFLKGEKLNDISMLRYHSSYMIDAPSFYPFLSGMKNLELIGMLKKGARDSRELLELVGLGGTADKQVGKYSTGMKQRLAIAQIMMHGSELLFLDEPFRGLDPNGFQEVIELLKEINAKGVTILVSSHLLHELERLSDAYLLLHKGELLLDMSKEDLMASRRNVVFTFEEEEAWKKCDFLVELDEAERNGKQLTLEIAPNRIAETLQRFVDAGAVPVNVETKNKLQDKYLQITS